MKKIYFLGECMVELRAIDESGMGKSFAGDVYNSSVYLKRCFPEVSAAMVTAVGKDTLSHQMINMFEQENIDTQWVFQHEDKAPGLYLVETDAAGERSFTYWRNDSAARKVVSFLNDDVVKQLADGDMFFFSGISLAVVEESARELLWQKLEYLKHAGVTLVFDPNYRARLWPDSQEAKRQFDCALQLSDIILPGVEDLTALYGIKSSHEVMTLCQQYQLAEVVVKNGPASVLTYDGETMQSHDIAPVRHVVDTTSAGDAFNGVYLGVRLSGRSIAEAVRLAAKAAATVIQHPGAIAPCASFKLAMIEAGV